VDSWIRWISGFLGSATPPATFFLPPSKLKTDPAKSPCQLLFPARLSSSSLSQSCITSTCDLLFLYHSPCVAKDTLPKNTTHLLRMHQKPTGALFLFFLSILRTPIAFNSPTPHLTPHIRSNRAPIFASSAWCFQSLIALSPSVTSLLPSPSRAPSPKHSSIWALHSSATFK
jgi:hypothetical protein